MAERGRGSSHRQLKRIRDARRLSELFRGRISEEEAMKLLRLKNWDMDTTVSYVFSREPADLAQDLGDQNSEARIASVTEDQALRDLASRHEIGNSVRQFACAGCKHPWWYRVPNRKPVSSCKKCRTKYDAIPRDQEWGWAEFECDCGHTFKGAGWMGRTGSMCYKCSSMCMPVSILPPYRRGERRTSQSHTCSGTNCYNRQGHGHANDTCVHPKSQPPEILVASQPHASSGSTVKTFLSQDDLEALYDDELDVILESEDDVDVDVDDDVELIYQRD